MNVFRYINLQRTLSILLLFTALFSQIQTLYACDSMADKPKHICCCGEHMSTVCPMVDNCAMPKLVTESACCEVSYDILIDAGMINSASTVENLTLLLDGAQPPPIVEGIQFSLTSLPIFSQLSLVLAPNEPRVFSRGNPTYLLTRRLRL